MSAGRANVVAERSLREVLAPFAPDAEAFEEAVRQRIAEREESEQEDEEETTMRVQSALAESPFLRSAAALLPPGLLIKGLALPAGAATKKAGWKGLAALVTVPALSAMMLAAAFVGGLTSVRRLKSDDPLDPVETGREISLWWWTHWWKALLGFALLTWLFLTQPVDALVALLLVSMLLVVLVLRHLSRVGAASRTAVGRYTGGFLWNLAVWGFMFNHVLLQRVSGRTEWATPVVLFCGALLCYGLAWQQPGWSRLRTVLTFALPLVASSAVLGLGPRPLSREACIAYVEDFEESAGALTNWSTWGRATRHLIASGDEELDLSKPQRALDDALFNTPGGPREVHPSPVCAAAGAGILRERWLVLLRDDGSTQRLLSKDRKVFFLRQYGARFRALAAGELSDPERDHLAERLIASWPEPDEYRALEDMALVVELLDVVGRPERADVLRESAHAALWTAWCGRVTEGSTAAPFDPNPDDVGDNKASFFRDESTAAAVEVLARFGAPERIDVRRVRRWLERASTPLLPAWFPVVGARSYHFRIAATRELFDHAMELPERRSSRVADWLLEERVFVGCLLLAALCVYATLRAPRLRTTAA